MEHLTSLLSNKHHHLHVAFTTLQTPQFCPSNAKLMLILVLLRALSHSLFSSRLSSDQSLFKTGDSPEAILHSVVNLSLPAFL